MKLLGNLVIAFLVFGLCFAKAVAQNFNQQKQFTLEGSVVEEVNYAPISGVQISTDYGAFALTDGLGEFKIKVRIGDVLVFESPNFQTVRHRITSEESIRLVVEDYNGPVANARTTQDDAHRQLIDSAYFYHKINIEKAIDLVGQSISVLGKNPNKRLMSQSLKVLGEIYLYHKQYDLAISNLEDSLKSYKTTGAQLLLGEALIADKQLDRAISSLKELDKVRNLVPYQRIRLYENLGDAYKGLNQLAVALDYYEEGLKVAKKNQVSPKVTDLTSKIGEAYAQADKRIEAEGYFDSSLELSRKESPKRAIQESEKVADFYNSSSRYNEEISQRKNSLSQLQSLGRDKLAAPQAAIVEDTITTQRINYKIGNAYLKQNKPEEAMPYFQKSIIEADKDDDLVVQKDATRKLSELYEYKGDFSKAFETYQAYVALVDTLYARKEQELSRLARMNRDIATKQNRISSLEQERELSLSKYNLALTEQQLYETRAQWQKWVIYSLFAVMLLLALTAFFFYRSNKQQKFANNLLALKSLRSQMNPHFIFNALNSVNTYIAKNDERNANRFLSEFSVLMRTVLENSEEDFIPMSKELELLQLYVKLEHSRFQDKFDYKITIDEGIVIDDFRIPPMLLQPYIENAIWHGLRYRESKGFLAIKVSQVADNVLLVQVEDNGIGRKRSKELKTKNQMKQRSKGMGNIKKRVAILNDMYKNKIEVAITDLHEDETGTRVSLKLKKD